MESIVSFILAHTIGCTLEARPVLEETVLSCLCPCISSRCALSTQDSVYQIRSVPPFIPFIDGPPLCGHLDDFNSSLIDNSRAVMYGVIELERWFSSLKFTYMHFGDIEA